MKSPQYQPGEIRRTVRTPDESIQSWAIQPPAGAPAFDPASGFPWNLDAGELFVQSVPLYDSTTDFGWDPEPYTQALELTDDSSDAVQFAPTEDPTVQSWSVGPPQNAVTAQAFNQPEQPLEVPVEDPTSQAFAIQPPAAAAFDPATGFPWAREGGEAQAQPVEDPTSQPWSVGPPQNAVIAQAFNQPRDELDAPVEDPTGQAFAIQPPAAPAFNPGSGFPWNADDSERFAAQQLVDDNVGQALGVPPRNAVAAQAFNAPQDVADQPSEDSTGQAWSIAPLAPAFDPGSVPWTGRDDLILPVWAVVDDSAQAWAVGPLPMLRAFNEPQPEPEAPAWLAAEQLTQSWQAALGIETPSTGGLAPRGYAVGSTLRGSAGHARPGGSAGHGRPGGSATHPRPQ